MYVFIDVDPNCYWYNTWNEPMERVDICELIITYSVLDIWLIKTDFGRPNTEIGQNMAKDHQVFLLALPMQSFSTCMCTYWHQYL